MSMKCSHGVEYPLEGKDPDTGPWTCNPDGSNPDCPACEPDAWAAVVFADVEHAEGFAPIVNGGRQP